MSVCRECYSEVSIELVFKENQMLFSELHKSGNLAFNFITKLLSVNLSCHRISHEWLTNRSNALPQFFEFPVFHAICAIRYILLSYHFPNQIGSLFQNCLKFFISRKKCIHTYIADKLLSCIRFYKELRTK